MNFLISPLEQFQVIPIISLSFGIFDFSITNSTVILAFGLFGFLFLINCFIGETPLLVSNCWFSCIEGLYNLVNNLLKDTVGKKGQAYFPFIFSLFSFILIANVAGLIPYSFTVTSHLIVTFSIAIMLFIGINFICIKEHGTLFFSLFLPAGSSLFLAFVLIPIEMVSYFVRPISLSVRLFANMMAGHTLIKVIAGFSWAMVISSGAGSLTQFLPLVILVIVMGLEFGVALIQAYVFTILTCIYLNDAINLH